MDITLVNALVKEGSPQQTEMAFLRRIKCRKIYAISREYSNYDLPRKRAQMQSGIVSEEPWPFSDPEFGLIPAADGSKIRCPFSNPSGFTVGTAEAYCSAMIYNRSGHWPQPIDHRLYPNIEHYAIARRLWVESEHPFDACNWAAFLALNGYIQRTKSPQTGRHYVGIQRGENQPGLVVWFHHRDTSSQATVSSRVDGEFQVFQVGIFDFIWVEIP